jgi:membrane-associated phospholipid phosphatase
MKQNTAALLSLALLSLSLLTPGTSLAQAGGDRWAGRTYQLNAWKDVPLLLIPTAMAGGWLLSTQQAHCAPHCDEGELNAFDRTVAGNYSTGWRLASDLTVAGTAAAAVTVLFVEEGLWAGLNDLVVIAEAVIWTNAWCVIGNLAARRPRPYMYGVEAPLDQRNSAHGSLSFLSGHTGMAAAFTTSLFSTLRRRNPHGALQWWALGAGTVLTAAVAVGRTQAGDHFPSDVLLGAAVGASMGLLIPALHDSPLKLAPAVGPGQASVTLNLEL